MDAKPNMKFYALSAGPDFGVAWLETPKNKLDVDTLAITSCTTSEGLRYRVSKAGSGDVIWEGWQPLGYDTQGNCED